MSTTEEELQKYIASRQPDIASDDDFEAYAISRAGPRVGKMPPVRPRAATPPVPAPPPVAVPPSPGVNPYVASAVRSSVALPNIAPAPAPPSVPPTMSAVAPFKAAAQAYDATPEGQPTGLLETARKAFTAGLRPGVMGGGEDGTLLDKALGGAGKDVAGRTIIPSFKIRVPHSPEQDLAGEAPGVDTYTTSAVHGADLIAAAHVAGDAVKQFAYGAIVEAASGGLGIAAPFVAKFIPAPVLELAASGGEKAAAIFGDYISHVRKLSDLAVEHGMARETATKVATKLVAADRGLIPGAAKGLGFAGVEAVGEDKKITPKDLLTYAVGGAILHGAAELDNAGGVGLIRTPKAQAVADAYDVLGVSADATDKEIKRAFRAKTMEAHPDQNPNDPAAHEKFVRLMDAWDRIRTARAGEVPAVSGLPVDEATPAPESPKTEATAPEPPPARPESPAVPNTQSVVDQIMEIQRKAAEAKAATPEVAPEAPVNVPESPVAATGAVVPAPSTPAETSPADANVEVPTIKSLARQSKQALIDHLNGRGVEPVQGNKAELIAQIRALPTSHIPTEATVSETASPAETAPHIPEPVVEHPMAGDEDPYAFIDEFVPSGDPDADAAAYAAMEAEKTSAPAVQSPAPAAEAPAVPAAPGAPRILEHPVAAVVRDNATGKDYKGRVHFDAVAQIKKEFGYGDTPAENKRFAEDFAGRLNEELFQTSDNRVVSRGEAQALQAATGRPVSPGGELHAQALYGGGVATTTPTNVELQSNLDPRMARFSEVPESAKARMIDRAIHEIVAPIAASEGVRLSPTRGLGSWFSEGSLSVADAVQINLPNNLDPDVVKSLLARLSIAMKQAGYFAARPAKVATGRWGLELDFKRDLTTGEYTSLVETISNGSVTFNGTTMVSLAPGRTLIVLNEGVGEDDLQAEVDRIGSLLPSENIGVKRYQVDTVENFDADSFGRDVRAGDNRRRVDGEAAAVYDEIAEEVGHYFDNAGKAEAPAPTEVGGAPERAPIPGIPDQVRSRTLYRTWAHHIEALDAQNAPDSEYRGILSTGSKARLKKGETWRGKVLSYIQNGVDREMAELEGRAPVPDEPARAPLPKAKKAPDFDYSGEWIFEHDGKKYRIYKDHDSEAYRGRWFEANPVSDKLHDQILAYTKSEAIEKIVARQEAAAAEKPARKRLTKKKVAEAPASTPEPPVAGVPPTGAVNRAEVEAEAMKRFPGMSSMKAEMRARVMAGYDDALAGNDKWATMTGPYGIGYGAGMRIRRAADISPQMDLADLTDDLLAEEESAPYDPVQTASVDIPLQRVTKKGSVFWQKGPEAGETRHGLLPFLRMQVEYPALHEEASARIPQKTTPANAAKSVSILDEARTHFPNPLESEETFARYMSRVLNDNDVPLPPYAAIKRIANPDLIVADLARATDKQISDARAGLMNGKAVRAMYERGVVAPRTTTKMFLWGILSRGVQVYTQESAFLDAMASKDVDLWVDQALAGKWDDATQQAYEGWVGAVFPTDSPGHGTTHNLGSFGKQFLQRMSQSISPELVEGRTGVTGLQRLHEMISDPTGFPSKKLRREFHKIVTGVGIDNKVLSFALLVTGRNDVMVLDRVRIRTEFNDGRFGDYNLYDGVKNDVGDTMRETGLAGLFNGIRGLAYYEALEDAYAKVLPEVYAKLGRPEDATLGNYHWEGWVADSSQEVGHGTIDAIADEARGVADPYEGVGVPQGKMNEYSYGATYRWVGGKPVIQYPLSTGEYVWMNPTVFKEFRNQIKVRKEGVVPNGFSVEAAGETHPWWGAAGVDRDALDRLARRYGKPNPRSAIAANDGSSGADGAGPGAVVRLPAGRRLLPARAGRVGPEQLLTAAESILEEAALAYGPQSELPDILTRKLMMWVGDDATFSINGMPTVADRVDAIEKNLHGRGELNIIGKKVTGPARVAKLLRAFRDPRFEHSHFLLLDDDGRIVHHAMDTAGSVDRAAITPERLDALLDAAVKYNARRVVMAHNHPSGLSKPSLADLRMTEKVARILADRGMSLQHHLVIDHDEAHVIEINDFGNAKARKIAVRPDQIEDWTTWTKDAPSSRTPEDFARVLRQAPEAGQAFMAYLDTQNRVLALEPHVARSLYRSPGQWLADSMRELGASSVLVVVDNHATPGAHMNISLAMDKFVEDTGRHVLDVLDVSQAGTARVSARNIGTLEASGRTGSPDVVASVEMNMAEGETPYDPTIAREGELPDPREKALTSTDVVERVTAALKIGSGNEQYTRAQVALAVNAAMNPQILAALHSVAPNGRGAYKTERWLDDIQAVAPQHENEVRSPEAVIRELSDALHLPVLTTGNRWAILRRKGTAGAYKPGARIVRIKERGDIETTMHEVGHHVHELVYGLGKNKKLNSKDIDPIYAKELEALVGSRMGGDRLEEGVAEFFRRFVTNPMQAAMRAPQYHDHIVEALERDHPEVLEALMKARYDFNQWLTGTDAARIRSRIHSAVEPSPGNANKSKWDSFMAATVDDLHYLQKVVEQVQGTDVLVSEAPHLLAKLLRGSGGPADYIMRDGQFDWMTKQKIGPSLEAILKPIFESGQRDDFTAYLVARWGRARILQGFDVGFDIGTADNTIRQLESPTFLKGHQEVVDFNRNMLKILRDSGVISVEDYDNIEKSGTMDNYIPAHRVMPDGSSGGGKSRELFQGRKVVKRFKGSTADIIDPLESMVKNVYTFTHAAMQQRISDALITLSEGKGAGALLDLIQPAPVVHKRPLAEIWDDINKETGGALGSIPAGAQDAVAKIFRPGDFFGKQNVISVMQEGVRKWYEVTDPDLYQALMQAGDHVNAIIKFMSVPSQLLRAGATDTPEFIGRNPLKDQLTAFVNSEYGYIPFWDLAKGMSSLLGKDDYYRMWKLSGGEYATTVDLDRAGRRRHIEELMKSGRSVGDIVKTPLHALQALSALMENGTRMGEFRRAFDTELAKTGNTQESMDRGSLAARSVTTDFSVHGAKTKAVRLIATFWNAGLQGDVRLIQAAKKNPRNFTLKALLSITLPTILLALANKDDDEYWEIPQWQRDMFWLVKVPVQFIPHFLEQSEDSGIAGQALKPFITSKDGVWLRFPKPFGVGQVFGSIPERMIEWVHTHDPHGLEEAVKDLMPLGGNALFGGVPDITALQPFAENWANYSRFLRRPLVGGQLQDVEPQYQYTGNTSEFAKDMTKLFAATGVNKLPLANTLGLQSPIKFDNVFRGWTGGLGAYATGLYGALAEPIARRADPDKRGKPPAQGLADIPLVRGFAVRSPAWSSESITRFYERYTEVGTAANTFDMLQKQHRGAEASKYRARHQKDLAEHSRLEYTAHALGNLRAASASIENSDMSPQQKAEMIEMNGQLATELAARAMGRAYKSKLTGLTK